MFYWSANPKTVQKLPPAQLQFAVPQEVTVGPLYFLHVTSGHNDLATEKKLSKFGTTLFGYLNSKVKVNDLYIFFYLNCHAMYMSNSQKVAIFFIPPVLIDYLQIYVIDVHS